MSLVKTGTVRLIPGHAATAGVPASTSCPPPQPPPPPPGYTPPSDGGGGPVLSCVPLYQPNPGGSGEFISNGNYCP